MLYKNHVLWDSKDWMKYIPESVATKFKKTQSIQFIAIGGIDRNYEDGRSLKVEATFGSKMECEITLEGQKCIINCGVQSPTSPGGSSFTYSHPGIEINGTLKVESLEEVFVMIHHPRFQTDEETEEVCRIDLGKEGKHSFKMEDVEKVNKNRFISDKEITNLCSQIYNVEESEIRGMYINQGYGEQEPDTAADEVYQHFIDLAKRDFKKAEAIFRSTEDITVAVVVKAAIKKEKLKYAVKTGAWTLGSNKESFFIVPEGNREVAKATVSLIEYLKNATDQTILAELSDKKK
mgnify:FL=1